MDVIEFINNNGKKKVPNPNYNANSKKRGEPRTIEVPDLGYDEDPRVNLAIQDFTNQTSISAKEAEKYNRAGLNWNNWENLDKQLSDSQSTWSKWKNALAQTVVSEIGLGTAIGIADLFDMIGQAVGISDPNYQNPLSAYLTEKQEEFRNYAPIYSDPSLNISNGGLLDAGWWASNIPSVASSLTLLIPSTGAVKGLSALGKINKVANFGRKAAVAVAKAEKAVKAGITGSESYGTLGKLLNTTSGRSTLGLAFENGTTAALSRAMENYQEARQTYNDMYADASEYLTKLANSNKQEDKDKYNEIIQSNSALLKDSDGNSTVDTNNPNEVAKAIAKASADRTFQMDWVNVVSDVVQMYALRNAWKGLKNAPEDPSSIRRANRNAAKNLFKSEKEIAEEEVKRSFKSKAWEKVHDKLLDSKLLITSELGEGVEEAVNYIAQQEGMTLGNTLLNRNDDDRSTGWGNSLSKFFDKRMEQYIKAPELWDSAFWGVMGGVVFQGVGSKLRRISNKLTESKSEANDESKQSLPWYALDELPETKRRKAEIEARGLDFKQYKQQLERIRKGIDVYKSTSENEVKFDSEEEQRVAEKKLKDELITKMTLRAMNSGNLDMFKAFMADDNVRKGMVKAGLFNEKDKTKTEAEVETESKQYIDEALKKVEQVEDMYDQELVTLNNASVKINTDNPSESAMPAEYLQIMAVNNVNTRLAMNNNDIELAAINSRIGQLKHQFKDQLDKNIDYEHNIKLGVLTYKLKDLYAKRKALKNDKSKSLSNEIAIDEINKQIYKIEDQLSDEELIYSTGIALQYKLDEKGRTVRDADQSEAYAYQDAIIVNRAESDKGTVINLPGFEYLSPRSRKVLTDAEKGVYDTLTYDTDTSFSDLSSISPELNSLYQTKAALELNNLENKTNLVRTVYEVRQQASFLNNTMNEARAKAIDNSNKTILDLYNKYEVGKTVNYGIRDAIYDIVHGRDLSYSNYTDEEKQALKDAVEVLQLTKPQNQELNENLERQFFLAEAKYAQQEVQNTNNVNDETNDTETQSSTENQQLNTDTQNSNLNNSSETTDEVNTDEQTQQNQNEIEVSDPQDISNRQSIGYVKFYTKQGNTSGKINKQDNGGVKVYDNQDGTYTIDATNNPKVLNDKNVFENTDEVDLTRPYEVEQKPIATRNKRGRIVITEKGRLVNTDTEEYKQSHQEQENASQEQIDTNTEQSSANTEQTDNEEETTNNNNQATSNTEETPAQPYINPATSNDDETSNVNNETLNQNPQDSSTGELEESISNISTKASSTTNNSKQSTQQAKNQNKSNNTDEPIIEQTPSDDNIKNEALSKIMSEVRKNHDINIDNLAKQLADDYVAKGMDRAFVEKAINWSASVIKRRLDKQKNKEAQTMRSSIDELIVQSTLVELNKPNPFVLDYTKAVKNLIEQYCKENKVKTINGKVYINCEDMLRYINNITSDQSTGDFLYTTLTSYLKTNEAKQKFISTDEDNFDKEDFIEQTHKSEQERYTERLGSNSIQRVDIKSYKQNILNNDDLSDEEKQKLIKDFNDALDDLRKDQKLKTVIKDNIIQITDEKGRIVGTLPIPGINENTGAFEMYNDGWKTDVLKVNGNIVSKLCDLWSRWLTSNTKSCEKLNDILYELAFANPDNKRKKELLDALDNNKEIIFARGKGYISTDADINKLANGLIKIWKFAKISSKENNVANNIIIRRSINAWFNKLHYSYSAVKALQNNKNIDVSVATISDGEIIQVQKEVTDESLLPPVNEAIAGGYNPTVNKLGIVPFNTNSVITFSGGQKGFVKYARQGRTFVLIPNRRGYQHSYVKAFPVNIAEDFIGEDAKAIRDAVIEEFNNVLTNYFNEHDDKAFNTLKDFVIKLLGNTTRGNKSLFDGLTITTTNDKIIINTPGTSADDTHTIIFYKNITITNKQTNEKFKKPSTSFTIRHPEFEKNKAGYNTKNFAYDDIKGRKYIKEILLDNLKFRLSPAYLLSDNVSDQQMLGFATRKKGKFEISIRDKNWTYDSFSDFILSNNLVRLNTKPREDGKSNFRRYSENQEANQIFDIELNIPTSSPVEESSESQKKTSQNTVQEDNTPIQENNTHQLDISQKAQTILESTDDKIDKAAELVALAFDDEKTLKAFQSLGLLPKSIIFDAEFNKNEGNEEINAQVNTRTGVVTVGTKWKTLFDNKDTRQQAIRKLIHEQLHNKLSRNRGYLRSAKEIYNEFKEALEQGIDNPLFDKFINRNNITKEQAHEYLKQYLFSNLPENKAIEEFLVESLTSSDLAEVLNTIDAKDYEAKKGSKNLFQKIFELLTKVFGWDIRKGSLYEKELKTLRANFNNNETIQEKNAKEKSADVVDKITKDGEHVRLTPDEIYYINDETNELEARVTSAIQADDENVGEDGKVHRFDPNNPWVTPSTNIGTGVDEFVRDFFLGRLDNMSNEALEQNYPNVTGYDWNEFRQQLKEFKQGLANGTIIKDKKITIVSRDIKASGKVDIKMPDGSIKQLPVNGTLDLLGYDEDGKFYIFDMKTVHSKDYKSDNEKSKKWNRQLQLYKQFLETKYNINVESCYIIPIKVEYDTPKGATRKDGSDMGGTAEYTVRNPKEKTNYDNPMRTQLLQDGEEFRGAEPKLEPILKKNPKPGSIQYKNLDDNAKALLDGTVTVENYNQTNTNTQQEQKVELETSNEIIVTDDNTSIDSKFGEDISDDLLDEFDSSVTELNNVEQSNITNYSSEEQSIIDKAKKDNTFMKAPNGNPTNLTERQWVQVRTKAFKDWFGDWERVAYSSKFRESHDIPNSITSATYQGVYVSEALFDPDMAPDGGKRVILLGDKYIGEIPIIESKDKIRMSGSLGAATEIEEEYRGKGYGKKAHLALANIAKAEGKTLYSDKSNSDAEDALWRSLVKDGIAEVISESPKVGHWNHTAYRIINDKLPQADDIDSGDRNVSKVVDENGEPLVVYHKSPNVFNIFDTSKKRYNVHEVTGIWASPINRKGRGYGENIYPLFFNLRNPINTSIKQVKNINELRTLENNALKNINSDGAILDTVDKFGYETQYYVKKANQVKSATDNNGDFSNKDDNIYHSSVTELANNVSNVESFTQQLPLDQQAKFTKMVTSAEVSVLCR